MSWISIHFLKCLLNSTKKHWWVFNAAVSLITLERTHQLHVFLTGHWLLWQSDWSRGEIVSYVWPVSALCLCFWAHLRWFRCSACRGLRWHFLIPVRITSLIPTTLQLCSDTERSAVSVDGDKIIWWRWQCITQVLWVCAKLFRGQYSQLTLSAYVSAIWCSL